MGWFWGRDDTGDKPGSSEDPLRKLDPDLRQFLARESPVKYTTSTPPPPPPPTAQTPSSELPPPPQTRSYQPPKNTQFQSSHQNTQNPSFPSPPENSEKPIVPPQSLFQDGRYAHLWKTYTPLAEIEAANKTENEKILDILDGYKHRKAEIGRAALENCADEQWTVNECFGSATVSSLTGMCRKENQKLSRCYVTQAKFLKALGYLSTFDRSAEVDERIQMHADKLYHTMLEQEEAMELARKEGRPLPAFPPLLQVPVEHQKAGGSQQLQQQQQQLQQRAREEAAGADETAGEESRILGTKVTSLPSSTQDKIRRRLEGLEGRQRELEERSILAELRAGEGVLQSLDKVYGEQEKDIKARKAEGKQTLSDWVFESFLKRKGKD